jgi:hypothetical protein
MRLLTNRWIHAALAAVMLVAWTVAPADAGPLNLHNILPDISLPAALDLNYDALTSQLTASGGGVGFQGPDASGSFYWIDGVISDGFMQKGTLSITEHFEPPFGAVMLPGNLLAFGVDPRAMMERLVNATGADSSLGFGSVPAVRLASVAFPQNLNGGVSVSRR